MDVFVDTNILLDAKIGDVYKFFLANKDDIYIEHNDVLGTQMLPSKNYKKIYIYMLTPRANCIQ